MFYVFPLLMLQLCELVYFLHRFIQHLILVHKTANNLHNFLQIIERTLKSGCLGLIPLEARQWWLMAFIGALGRQSRSTEKPYLDKSKKEKKVTIGYLCMLGDRLDNLNDGNFLNFFFFNLQLSAKELSCLWSELFNSTFGSSWSSMVTTDPEYWLTWSPLPNTPQQEVPKSHLDSTLKVCEHKNHMNAC